MKYTFNADQIDSFKSQWQLHELITGHPVERLDEMDFRVSVADNNQTTVAPLNEQGSELLKQCGYGRFGWDAVTVGHREALTLLQIICDEGLTWETERPADMDPQYTNAWRDENAK